MPNCFTLTRKGETEPTKLTVVDEFICEKLCGIVDPKEYYHNWVDTLGFSIAVGHSFAQMRHVWGYNEYLIEVIDLLEAYFTVDAWAQR